MGDLAADAAARLSCAGARGVRAQLRDTGGHVEPGHACLPGAVRQVRQLGLCSSFSRSQPVNPAAIFWQPCLLGEHEFQI